MTATIQRLDDSYIVRLPIKVVERIKMNENDIVQILEEYGKIIIQKPQPLTIANDTTRKSIDELFAGYEDEYEPIPIDWGTPVGDEVW